MEIVVGKYSGFCNGVNYTYTKAKEVIKEGKTYCLGEIIHNDKVIKELIDLGMITIYDIKEVPDNSRVIFRAHGEKKEKYEYAKKHNIEVIDLTCGKVRLIHNKVEKEKDNSFIILIGKRKHPEVVATISFSGNDSFIVENKDDIFSSFDKYKKSNKNKVYVISQTTFSSNLFDELVSEIKLVYNCEIKVDKTICDATSKRQDETKDISLKCNKVLVIGSKNSSNTMELFNISQKNCEEVYFVEDICDLNNINFDVDDKIGLVAGASAPNYLIDEIVSKISLKKDKNRL